MNGYSKMKAINTQKSRSMDFSDVFSFSQTPKAAKKTDPESDPTSKSHESSQIKESNTEKEDGDGNGEEKFGPVLTRNCSVSSTSGFQLSAVKRAFSVKRSSSVSERYCRIYDQSVTLASPIDAADDGDDEMRATRRSVKKKHRGGKILKACKRLFGL
ncbi:hypothetical protein SLA2020_279600 [Shorea laevis]